MKVDWTDVHQVDEGKRKQIRLIFREAAKGRSYRRLLRICEEVGLTNASGGPMGLSSLHNMLTNPFYYGYVTVDGTPVQGKHQPIVEATLPKIKKDQQKTSSLLVESRPWSNAHEI